MEHHLTLALVLIPTLGVLSQWVAWRVRIPAIVLLLATGVLAGPVTGILAPSRQFGPLLGPIVKLCVAIILFEGGLNLHLYELKQTGKGVRRLVVLGVPVAFVLGALACRFVGGIPWSGSLVFAAILVVTGPTVIMPLLRHARLARGPASLLKWEGIVNDPIGALLAVLVFEVVSAEGTVGSVAFAVVATVVLAALLGIGGGWALGQAFRRGWVPEYLKGPVLFGSALLAYVLADLVQHEAGLAAATVLGLALGNQRLAGLSELRRFKEYITVLLVSAVFVLLTADLDPAGVSGLGGRHLLLLAVLLLVVRPLAIFLSTWGAGLDWRERVLVGWIAPRGVVAAAVTATFVPDLVPLMFAFIALTVTVHGLSIAPLARRLGLAAPDRGGILIVGASPWTLDLAVALGELSVPVLLTDSSWSRLRGARMAGVPVRYGEVVSEASEESLELNGIATLLAATGNDAYNALVCVNFAFELGRDRVFQLPMARADEDDPRGLHHTVRGRIAFDTDAVLERLLHRHYQGWTFARTKLTGDYAGDAWRTDLPPESLPLLLVRPDGAVVIHTEKVPLTPGPGDTVLSFVPPRA